MTVLAVATPTVANVPVVALLAGVTVSPLSTPTSAALAKFSVAVSVRS